MSVNGLCAGRWSRLLALSLICLAFSPACSKKEQAKKAKPPVPVLTASASRKDIPVQLRAIGNVEAFSTVSIKSLVPGEVTGVYFKEGQDVKKGALLFTIDPHPIEADLRRAEGVLAKDTVEATNAEVDAGRYSDLFKRGMVSRQQLDQSVTAAASLKETIRADRAAIESIKVQLGYTKIYSPIAGKTGNLNVNRGNIVKANDTPYLVVINQIQPVYVTFSVPENFLSEIQSLMSKGKMKVAANISGDTGAPAEGYLSFIDNAVDITTGNVKLKATFENKSDKKLWPGQFVDVILTLSTKTGATVIPAQAVQTGQKGQYVFVVKPDKTVENRPVVLGLTKDNDAVIEKGVNPGETVVTDGQVRLVPGSKVDIKTSL